MTALNQPVAIFAQLASRHFAFIELDQFFVLQGQAIRINKFTKFVNDFDTIDNGDESFGEGNGNSNGNGHGSGGNANGPGVGGPGGAHPGIGGPGAPLGGPNGVGGGSKGGGNGNAGGGGGSKRREIRNRGFGTCPSLIDDTLFLSDEFGFGGSRFGGSFVNGFGEGDDFFGGGF
jgi:hypothetical protein